MAEKKMKESKMTIGFNVFSSEKEEKICSAYV